MLAPADWSSQGSPTTPNRACQYLAVDRDPDEFQFNINGMLGSFFMDHNGNWQIKSKQNLAIKVENDFSSLGSVAFFSKFKLTDGQGNVISLEALRVLLNILGVKGLICQMRLEGIGHLLTMAITMR